MNKLFKKLTDKFYELFHTSAPIATQPKQIKAPIETPRTTVTKQPTQKEPTPTSKRSQTVKTLTEKIRTYLNNHFEFRYNLLTEQTEYRPLHTDITAFTGINQRELNTLCIQIRDYGINCWDRDLIRYINSSYIPSYHPFQLYFEELPEWDGQDRLEDLAGRISTDTHWICYFHRWMLALTAQWMNRKQLHANSVAPLLISTEQGWQKSTFCKSIVPEPLQAYYTDQMDLAGSRLENKLALMGLINLDEFDRLSPRRMAQLKNLMQMPALTVRKAYQQHYQQLPRIASFIGTSNRKDLLTDPTGSRRFLCVEVKHAIDCTHLDLDQIYAQLKTELLQGARFWFTHEEEKEIQEHNAAFYQASPEEEIFQAHFRAALPDEDGELLSLAEIIEVMRNFHRGLLSQLNLTKFGNALVASGVEKIHTRTGNRYRVVRVCEGGES